MGTDHSLICMDCKKEIIIARNKRLYRSKEELNLLEIFLTEHADHNLLYEGDDDWLRCKDSKIVGLNEKVKKHLTRIEEIQELKLKLAEAELRIQRLTRPFFFGKKRLEALVKKLEERGVEDAERLAYACEGNCFQDIHILYMLADGISIDHARSYTPVCADFDQTLSDIARIVLQRGEDLEHEVEQSNARRKECIRKYEKLRKSVQKGEPCL
jgi:hypothetical protein